MGNNIVKELWENDEYGIHHVCVLVRVIDRKDYKYELRWRYGRYGWEQGLEYSNEPIKDSKKIIQLNTKSRTVEEPKPEPTGYGDLFGY